MPSDEWCRRCRVDLSGPQFRDCHLLIDDQGDQLYAMTDPSAERVRQVGGLTLRSIGHIAGLRHVSDDDSHSAPASREWFSFARRCRNSGGRRLAPASRRRQPR